MVEVAAVLEEYLERNGIGTVRSNDIHDAKYNLSYLESEKTVKKFLDQNKELKILLDIHRDAGVSRKDSVTVINGKYVAKILIIVGSDARMPFPNWKQNLALARKIDKRLNEKYPGISRGVRVKEGRYNQHYHTGALLVEIDSVKNTEEEAKRSVEFLGEVLVDILRER